MNKHKKILNQFLELGGIATQNNFYSPNASTLAGALVDVRRIFKELKRQNLIKPLPTITRVRNLSQEQFWYITKLGAKYVDRQEDYKWKGTPKSPYNIMHESMIRDIALSFLRSYPKYGIEIDYNAGFEGIRPDMIIRMKHKANFKKYIFLVEVERKKDPSRLAKGKFYLYEKVFSRLNFKKYSFNAPLTVLFIYANHDYNCFCRPQEYHRPHVMPEISKLNKQLLHLLKLSSGLPEYRYRFMIFPNFYQLQRPVWFTPQGKFTALVLNH